MKKIRIIAAVLAVIVLLPLAAAAAGPSENERT